jgi:prolyl-tRNA synthetase
MGALVMAHSDDNGLVLPPKLAPIQVVIVPIYKGNEQLEQIAEKAKAIKEELEEKGISVKFDDRDTHKPGWKFAEYELKGVPVRIALGPRDLENGTLEVARRDTLTKEVKPMDGIADYINQLLKDIQVDIYNKAKVFKQENTFQANSWEEFKDILENKGGFIEAHWDGTSETENKIKDETKATIRCIPVNNKQEEGQCIYTGKPSKQRVIFAKAY